METNDIVIEAWNTVLFDKFVRFKHLLIDGLSAHSNELLSHGLFKEGDRVVDIGCGFGDSTRRIALQVGNTGEAVGVDCAENFINSCIQETRDEGISNAHYQVVDVETMPLSGPYDAAFARFGTMFFMNPGAALRNIRKALKPGAEFHQIVWRKKEDNPWLHEAEQRVATIVPIVSHEDTNQVHCGPGPFSMSGADMVSSMLQAVGYHKIRFERFDANICIGRDIDEAIDFAMNLGPAGEIIRLAGDEGEKRLPEVKDALKEVVKPYLNENGVWAPSSTWFISATNPG